MSKIIVQVAGAFKRIQSTLRESVSEAGKKLKNEAGTDAKPSRLQEIVAAVAVCAVLVAVAAGGIFLYTNLKSDSKPAPKGAHGYTLTPPEGWTRVNPTPDGASVVFTAAAADSDATNKTKAFIVVQSAALNKDAQHASFDAIAQAYVTQLARSHTDYQQVTTSTKTIANTPMLFVTFTSHSSEAALTTESLFTVKDGISYTVNGGALTSAWPQRASEIEQSLLTFRP